jgi:hypothetical protein
MEFETTETEYKDPVYIGQYLIVRHSALLGAKISKTNLNNMSVRLAGQANELLINDQEEIESFKKWLKAIEGL